jgi:hypothetical protein
MSSSYIRCAPLDASWLDDSSYSSSSSSSNADNNYDPDVDNNMPLPPENSYTTKDKLFDAIQAWAKEYKYAFRIGRSKPLGKSRKKYTYFCTRCGETPIMDCPENDPRRPHNRIRSTSTKKTGCAFSVCGIQVDNNQWEVRHRLDAKFGLHNHPQSYSALEHIAHRRPDKVQVEKARELHGIGM